MPLLFSITWGSFSGWWTPVCLLLGLLYAWLLYRNPVDLSPRMRNLLAAIRTITVFVISWLLVSPMVKSVNYEPQKPLVLIAQDNSSSIQSFRTVAVDPKKVSEELSALKKALGSEYDVREFNFDGTLHDGLSKNFTGKQTDISAALHQLNDRFVNQNIGAVILATDGLYNRGADPQYEARNLKSSIYTVALGDTTIRRDLLIANINYNKTAFLGNDFEVELLLAAYQSRGEQMRLTATEDGAVVASQQIAVQSDAFRKAITLKLHADKKGIHKFTFSIAPIKNEVSAQNNTETIYVEVLDARQKIVLVYSGIHPDISVIKQAVQSNTNYELKTIKAEDAAAIKWTDYSLAICYQPTGTLASAVTKSRIPSWYIAGTQTDLAALNNAQKLMQISSGRADVQEVFADAAAGFSLFTLSDSTTQKISKFPPLLAAYGTYTNPSGATILLKQKIGNVATPYPLLIFGDDGGRRQAVLAAEGIWRWNLAEYQQYGNHHAVEELFTQAVQYLTANANQQRFRVYPAKTVFDEGENVLMNAELYNDALELINTPDVKIDLQNSAGKNYSFLFSRSGQGYQLDAGVLPAGDYTYTAAVKLGTKTQTVRGQFNIRLLNVEARQSTANHQLLYALAKQSGGQMVRPNEIDKLADLIRKNENIKTVVYEDKHFADLIDVKWIFLLILTLLTAEWFLRKREGL